MNLFYSSESHKDGAVWARVWRRSFEKVRDHGGISLFSFWIIYVLCAPSSVAGQQGFVSIDCGKGTDYTDPTTNISWVSDANYVRTGANFNVDVSSDFGLWNPNQLTTMRFFNKRSRDCYVVRTDPDSKYLVRAVFFLGDLNRTKLGSPSFSVYLNGSYWMTLDFAGYIWNTALIMFSWSREAILYSPGGDLNICLVRNLAGGPSFISSLELRKLDSGMYADVVNSSNANFLDLDLNQFTNFYYNRLNFGETDTSYNIRYPQDKYDRIWRPYPGPSELVISNINITSNSSVPDQPPVDVMNVGWIYDGGPATLWYGIPFPSTVGPVYISAYFQELDGNASAADVRGLNFNINDKFITSFNGSREPLEIHGPVQDITSNYLNISVTKANGSTLEPIINAAEIYNVRQVNKSQTSPQDVNALGALRSALQGRLDLTDWTGDPCVPVPFDWMDCTADALNRTIYRVTKLTLSGRGITGPIPQEISNLTALTSLELINNNLTQAIPDFQGLVHLKTLDLRNNTLNGSIPGFESLTSLTELSLSNNDLSGAIPGFSGLVNLEYLHLQDNNLNGQIPGFETLSNLTQLYVQHNQLTGEVPANLVNKAGLRILRMNNAGLVCSACNASSGSSHTGAILGGVLGGLAGLALALWIIWMVCTRKRRARDRIIKNMFKAAEDPTEIDSLIFKRRAAAGAMTVLSLQDVSDATRKFSRKVGSGAFGPVYHGNLPSGQEVAVKVKSVESRQGRSEFLNEVDLLSRIHHRNLVSLVGYCEEADQQILVYVFLPNGTLSDHLYADKSRPRLDWKTRLDIALNAAKGINYLHTDCVPRIIHRDVKSNNILLDETMVAKVADFGISKQTPEGGTSGVDTVLRGTPGYFDPEYFSSQRLTPKSDVFSFGIVLLEIICGRHPQLIELPDGTTGTLLHWVEMSVQSQRHADFVDPSLRGTFKHESMMSVLSLALNSTARVSANRPDMARVVRVLTEAIEIENSSQIVFSDNNPFVDHFSDPIAKGRTHQSEIEAANLLQNFGLSDAPGSDTAVVPR